MEHMLNSLARMPIFAAVLSVMAIEVVFIAFVLAPIAIGVMIFTGRNIFQVDGPCKP